jgi:hypothetical protein
MDGTSKHFIDTSCQNGHPMRIRYEHHGRGLTPTPPARIYDQSADLNAPGATIGIAQRCTECSLEAKASVTVERF